MYYKTFMAVINESHFCPSLIYYPINGVYPHKCLHLALQLYSQMLQYILIDL